MSSFHLLIKYRLNAWHTVDIILKIRDQTVKNRGKIPSFTTGAYILVEKVVNMILGLNNAIWKNQLRGLTDGLVRKCNCEHVNKQRFEWHKWTKTLRKFRGRTSGADISLDSKEQSQHFESLLLCLFICCPDVGQSQMASMVSLFYSSSSRDLCWLQAESQKTTRIAGLIWITSSPLSLRTQWESFLNLPLAC